VAVEGHNLKFIFSKHNVQMLKKKKKEKKKKKMIVVMSVTKLKLLLKAVIKMLLKQTSIQEL
jgi:hypothetical protein